MTVFDNDRLPVDVEIGALGGPMFSTTVLTLSDGKEQRNQNWARARGSYTVGYGISERADMDAVLNHFNARRGRYRGFPFKDWGDFKGTAQNLGTANGVTVDFQLVKNYTSGGITYTRRITRPVAGTLLIYDNGFLVSSGYTLGALGLVTFAVAPIIAHTITATFEFDVPARYDQDDLQMAMETFDTGMFPKIAIKEILE